MSLIGYCLDKVSRLTGNPDLANLPIRCYGRVLQILHALGCYRLPKAPVCRSFDGNAIIHLAPGGHLTERIWFLGYLEYDEEYFLRVYLKPGMTVVDVGANVGHITLICARRVRPNGAVHCFEPVLETFALLLPNIRENGLESVVRANRLAVAAKTGELVRMDCFPAHSGLNRLSLQRETEAAEGWSLSAAEVRTVALDDYVRESAISRIDLLKIDVEGAEMLVVSGASQVLERYKPALLCEFNDPALVRLGSSSRDLWDALVRFRYTFWRYNHRARTLRAESGPCPGGVVTLVGTPDAERLAASMGARLLPAP